MAIDDDCLLCDENVQWVISVLGPNMNPNRSDCLDGDYRRGVDELKKSYEHVSNSTNHV